MDSQKAIAARRKKAKKAKYSFEIQKHNSTVPVAHQQLKSSWYFQRLMNSNIELPEPHKGQPASLQDFIGPKDKRYAYLAPPATLSLYYRLYSSSRLKLRHLLALDKLLSDVQDARGRSSGLSSPLTEKVDTSKQLKDASAYLGSYENDAMIRFRHVFNSLKQHELTLLYCTIIRESLTTDEVAGQIVYRENDEINVYGVGQAFSGYKDKTAGNAAGVSRIHAMLDSIAEAYGIREN